MANYRRSAVLALAAAIAPSLTEAGKVTSSLQIHLPKDLTKDGGYEHREALFGIPPYGKSISQNVYYTDNNLCEGSIRHDWVQPFILMVDRGDCHFSSKVRNAQHSGAAAVLIADTTCQCKHEDLCKVPEGAVCEKHEPIMADDGSGYDIVIPSQLMFKQDADKVKEVLKNNGAVRAEMGWSVPNPDDHVEYEMWSSPTDTASVQFKEEWKDAAKALLSRASFAPKMYIYDGLKSNCRTEKGENLCYNLCTNEGRYCAQDPDEDLDFGISGADVVAESLRRLCIWDVYGKDGAGLEYWEYMVQFRDCDNSVDFMKESCVNAAMDRANVNKDLVNECIDKSGGLVQSERNSVLQDVLNEKEKNGIIVLPVAYVNGVPLRGYLDFDVMFEAVCAGYADGTKPAICEQCADCPGSHQCVVSGKCNAKNSGVSTGAFAGSLLAVIALFLVLAFIQHKRSQSQVREQVKQTLAEYMPLEKDMGNGGLDTALEQDDDAEGTFA